MGRRGAEGGEGVLRRGGGCIGFGVELDLETGDFISEGLLGLSSAHIMFDVRVDGLLWDEEVDWD